MIGHNEAALCPKCGRSNYEVLFESVTSIYVKPGTPEKDNPNVTTEFCRCNECGEYFNVEEQGGQIIRVIAQGNPHDTPTKAATISTKKNQTVSTGSKGTTTATASVSLPDRTVWTISIGSVVKIAYKGKEYWLDVDAVLKRFGKEIK